MTAFTPADILALRPCPDYTSEVITGHFAGAEALTLLDILRLDSVPLADRVWVACQPGVLPDDLRGRWIEGIVHRAITDHALHCGVPSVETWAARWLSGTDRSKAAAMAAAMAAGGAEAAAWAAEAAAEASEASEAAAEASEAAEAAWAAARAAARAAAWGTWAAAWAAAWDTAGAAELQLQISDLVALLEAKP